MNKVEAFRFVADELARCQQCGKEHEYRVVPGQHLRVSSQPRRTYLDPLDNHSYETVLGLGIVTYLRARADAAEALEPREDTA